MHICVPDTCEVKPQQGSTYLVYNIHIDGLYHCSLRYKQLLYLHQLLTKKFNTNNNSYQLPQFPPKKLLPLSNVQIEERRLELEKYLQYISQDKLISSSPIFNLFLLEAQRESTRIKKKHVHLDVELVNGQKIILPITTYDSADDVLLACCRSLGLSDRYHAYFCLCLCGYDVVRDKLIIKRRLSFNEAPFITLQMAILQQEQLQSVLSSHHTVTKQMIERTNGCHCLDCSRHSSTSGVPMISGSSATATSDLFVNNGNNDINCRLGNNIINRKSSFVTQRILLRKSYWDPIYDTYILNDQQALNLLFIQTVYDMKHSLMFVDRETHHQLETLLAQDLKLEYILLARTLKYYNYIHFEPCYSDYPRPRTKVMISIGSTELNMRVLKSIQLPNQRQASSALAPASSSSTASSSSDSSSSSSTSSTSKFDEPVLYCTSSLVPGGYQHLITKDDIVEEEYNFKVPLIRCWRLTSLETLNSSVSNNLYPNTRANTNHCHFNDINHNHRDSTAATSASIATTTLAGGKRRSLNLFNSIVGNSPPAGAGNNTRNNKTNNRCNNNIHNPASIICSGLDGTSLIATLTSTSSNNDNTTNGYDSSSTKKNSTTTSSDGHQNYRFPQHHENHQQQQQLCDHAQQEQPMSQYELSFEYLISKDNLKWITISSDQAIFISISLQGVVDELVSKREGSYHGNCVYQNGYNNTSTVRQQQNQSSSSRWSLYFNPSPPRPDHHPTQLVPPLYPPSSDTIQCGQTVAVENFTYMQRDGTQRQSSGQVRSFASTLSRLSRSQMDPLM